MNPAALVVPFGALLVTIADQAYCKRRIKTEENAKVVAAAWGGGGGFDTIPCRTSYFVLGRFEE